MMSHSYSLSDVISDSNMIINKQKVCHMYRPSDLNHLRTIQKKQKAAPLTILTQEKLTSVEHEWVKYKTTKQKTHKIKFPKEGKLNNLCTKKKNPDELIKLATSTAQLLEKKSITPSSAKNTMLKGQLSSLIHKAKNELKKK
ncbi:hypothetical protein SteCoe_34304 [Stentor coeruleus]|uniref:Uncharacterized protein n=1 Tax=Stentor coeruleus TaxID=5963 RepID=A0A1R2AV18_9CILI|nr:hypothetical protein SteCoe_34304 [Stentor coeruleus]